MSTTVKTKRPRICMGMLVFSTANSNRIALKYCKIQHFYRPFTGTKVRRVIL